MVLLENRNILENIRDLFYKNKWIVLLLVMLFSYSPFILNDYIYWDDFIWIGCSLEKLIEYNENLGSPGILGYISFFWYNILPHNLAHFIIVVFIYLISFYIYKILKYFRMSESDSLFITFCVALYPNVLTKISLSYSFTYFYIFCFSIASFYYITEKGKLKYLTIILFTISFQVKSLLCLYAVPFILKYYAENIQVFKLDTNIKRKIEILNICKSFFLFLRREILFCLLPFIFWILTRALCKVGGIYALTQYNAMSINDLSIQRMFECFISNLNWMLSLEENSKFLATLILVSIIGILFQKYKRNSKLIFIAIIIAFFSLFPYFVVQKIPEPGNFVESRHSVLLALPLAMTILSILNFFIKSKSKKLFQLIVILCLILNQLKVNYYILKDQFIYQSLVENFKHNEEIRKIKTFVVNMKPFDKSIYYNSINTSYEIDSIFYLAYGTKDHVSYKKDCTIRTIVDTYRFRNFLPYKRDDMILELPENQISISINVPELNRNKIFEYLVMYYTQPELYYDKIQNIVDVKLTKFNYNRFNILEGIYD